MGWVRVGYRVGQGEDEVGQVGWAGRVQRRPSWHRAVVRSVCMGLCAVCACMVRFRGGVRVGKQVQPSLLPTG